MPPKKKTKVSASTNEDSKSIGSPAPPVVVPKEPPKPAYDILKDPWTDEQETSLFKGIIRWKPNGMQALPFVPGDVN
jgi:MRG-binding protein